MRTGRVAGGNVQEREYVLQEKEYVQEREMELPRIIHRRSYALSERSVLIRPFGYIQGFWEIVRHNELSAGQKFSECVDGVGVILDAPRRYRHLLLAGSEFGKAPFLISGIWKTLFVCASSLVDLENESDGLSELNSELERDSNFSQESLREGGIILRGVYKNLLEIRAQGATNIPLEYYQTEWRVLARCVAFADSLSESQSALVRQAGSRGMYLVSAVAVVIARVFFAVVGTFAAALSFFWPHEKLVTAAFEGMGVLLIVQDVCYCTVKFISPKTFIHPAGWDKQYGDARQYYQASEQIVPFTGDNSEED